MLRPYRRGIVVFLTHLHYTLLQTLPEMSLLHRLDNQWLAFLNRLYRTAEYFWPVQREDLGLP